MLHKWKAVEGGGCAGVAGGGDQRRRCVAASLSMLIAATLAFLAYVAFFPNDGAGGLYRLWRCQGCAGELGEFPGDEAPAADGPSPSREARKPTTPGRRGRAPRAGDRPPFGAPAPGRRRTKGGHPRSRAPSCTTMEDLLCAPLRAAWPRPRALAAWPRVRAAVAVAASGGRPCAGGWRCRDGRTEKGGSSGKKNRRRGTGCPGRRAREERRRVLGHFALSLR